MFLSLSALFNTTCGCSALIIIVTFLLLNSKIVLKIGIFLAPSLLILIIIRFFLPFEFHFTQAVGTGYIYPLFSFFRSEVGGTTVTQLFLAIWFTVSMLLFVYFLLSYKKFFRMNYKMKRCEESIAVNVLERLKNESGYKKDISIRVAPGLTSPMAVGIFDKNILIPDDPFSEGELVHILAHELGHFRRNDILLKIIVKIICIIYWWNPFVYILKRQVVRIMEMQTDDLATEKYTELQLVDYMDCILMILKNAVNRKQTSQKYEDFSVFSVDTSTDLLAIRYAVLSNPEIYKKKKNNSFYKLIPVVISVALFLFSYLIIFEPAIYPSASEEELIWPNAENSYFVRIDGGQYEFYYEGQYYGMVGEPLGLEYIPIYNEKGEKIKKNRKAQRALYDN